MGHSVGDQSTWCARLEELLPVETINMGMGGYGIGQAWLWYKRERGMYRHQVQLFCFIAEDFRRMPMSNLRGYGKPVLKVVDGKLAVTNTPVPKTSYLTSSLIRNAEQLEALHSVKLMRKLGSEQTATDKSILNVCRKVFLELKEWHAQNGSLLVLVYIPRMYDYGQMSPYRKFVARFAAENDISFIDVTPAIDRLTAGQAIRLYEGHFNEEGNSLVAETIRDGLKNLPAFTQRLSGFKSSQKDSSIQKRNP